MNLAIIIVLFYVFAWILSPLFQIYQILEQMVGFYCEEKDIISLYVPFRWIFFYIWWIKSNLNAKEEAHFW